MEFLNIGLLIVIILAMFEPIGVTVMSLLMIGYALGTTFKLRNGPCDLSKIQNRRVAVALIVLLAVQYSSGDLRTTVHTGLLILVFNHLADRIVNSVTRSMYGNYHINLTITISIGLIKCGSNVECGYFLSGLLLGYYMSVIDIMMQEVNSNRRRE